MRPKTPLPRYPLQIATMLLHDEGSLAAGAVEGRGLATDDQHHPPTRPRSLASPTGATAARAVVRVAGVDGALTAGVDRHRRASDDVLEGRRADAAGATTTRVVRVDSRDVRTKLAPPPEPPPGRDNANNGLPHNYTAPSSSGWSSSTTSNADARFAWVWTRHLRNVV